MADKGSSIGQLVFWSLTVDDPTEAIFVAMTRLVLVTAINQSRLESTQSTLEVCTQNHYSPSTLEISLVALVS